MRHCILHIGIPKTGSSSIQKTLHVNRDRLAEAGILYQTTLPGEKGTAAHHKLGANVRGVGKQNRLKGINLGEFDEILRTTPADVVLISSESLSHPRLKAEKLQHLAHLITGNDFAVTAVVYIRPQPPLANSSYTQVVKSFQFEGSFDDFITKRLDGAAWHMNERLGVWFDQPNIRAFDRTR